jgi:hypothetical protein
MRWAVLNNGLNGAKRLNGWNDWNVCSLRAGHIRQHRKKHQSQVENSETLAFVFAFSKLILYPFAFIPHPLPSSFILYPFAFILLRGAWLFACFRFHL